jgi:hypothetical protein
MTYKSAARGKAYTREVLLKGRLSADELLVLTSLDELLVILKILFAFDTKQPILMRRSMVLSLLPKSVFPAYVIKLLGL